jgi:hypothetical protein
VIIDTADILKGYLGSHLQFLTPNEAGNPGAAPADHPPAPSHQAMNDREVMEHLARAANLTADVQGGLDERTIAEIREIKQRLSDAIPGMQGRSVLITIAEISSISMFYGYGRYASAGLIVAK